MEIVITRGVDSNTRISSPDKHESSGGCVSPPDCDGAIIYEELKKCSQVPRYASHQSISEYGRRC